MPREWRVKSLSPSSASSLLNCWPIAGWVTFSAPLAAGRWQHVVVNLDVLKDMTGRALLEIAVGEVNQQDVVFMDARPDALANFTSPLSIYLGAPAPGAPALSPAHEPPGRP